MKQSLPIAALLAAAALSGCGGTPPLRSSVAVADSVPHCSADRLGTFRTLTLKREAAAYGRTQHAPLPLAKGEVVLTFDDGPRPETMAKVLDALADQCVRASFFMTGRNLTQHPALARQAASRGHSTGLHSFDHPHLSQLAPADQLKDLERGVNAYTAALGHAPAAYRFPFLEETPTMLAALK
jgi:peptidoglycan/xylan/chitin deacetylase (PgdA/CDA1 family)